MSACNVLITPSAGYIATDTAVYTADLQLQTFGPKVATYPHMRCAFTGRGSASFLAQAGLALGFLPNPSRCIDGLISQVQQTLGTVYEACTHDMTQVGALDVQAFLVGWSEEKNKVVGYEVSHWVGGQYEPFQPIPMDDLLYLTPNLSASDPLLRKEHLIDFQRWNGRQIVKAPDEFMTHAMKKQRAMAFDLGDVCEDARGFIGGDLIVTEIGRHGIKQRSIHRWADQIGGTYAEHQKSAA